MELSRHSAQQIVAQIGKLVKQNINLMDESGHIIASTDPRRIGNFHEGAFRVITQHLPELYITPEDETPMVRRGVNLPIELDERIIGVIGITGGYDEVFAYGQIVKKMTEILILERRELDQRRLDDRVRSRFLEEWVLGTALSPQTLSDRGFALGIDIRTPRRVMVISLRNVTHYTGSLEGQMVLEQVEETVKGCIRSHYGALIFRNAARQVLLLSKGSTEQAIALGRKLIQTVAAKHSLELLVGIDGKTSDTHTAYLQANRAWRIASHRSDGLVSYGDLGAELILDDISTARKAEFLHKVFPGKSREEIRQYAILLCAWFAAEGSLAEAARALFIHKNTLQYRIRRMAEDTGLDVRKPSQALTLHLASLFFWDTENEEDILDS